jgi:hypothetical protein
MEERAVEGRVAAWMRCNLEVQGYELSAERSRSLPCSN